MTRVPPDPPAPFGIGPLTFHARAWPEAWCRYWDAHAIPVKPTPGSSIEVVHVAGAISGAAEGTDAITAAGCDGPAWRIDMTDVFSATYDVDERRLTIRCHEDTAPHLALGNPLRLLTSALLPLAADGLMVHASSGIYEGQGIAFAGISTAGKSTLAEGFADTRYLTDDVTLLGDVSSTPTVGATPFYGALGRRGEVRSAPLRALCVLGAKVPTTRIERLEGSLAAASVLRHVARFFPERTLTARLLDLVVRLVHTVPVLLVHRSLADSSDDVVRAALERAKDAS